MYMTIAYCLCLSPLDDCLLTIALVPVGQGAMCCRGCNAASWAGFSCAFGLFCWDGKAHCVL